MKYLIVFFKIELIIERLLLYAISNFKDLVSKKKQLYVTEFYVFKLKTDLLV